MPGSQQPDASPSFDGPPRRHGVGEDLTPVAQPDLRRDAPPNPDNLNFPLYTTANITVPIVQPPMAGYADMVVSDRHSDAAESPPMASLDFSNEPFANDQERLDWWEAFSGETVAIDEMQPPAGVEVSNVASSIIAPTVATRPKDLMPPPPSPLDTSLHQMQAPVGNTAPGAGGETLRENNQIGFLPSSAQQATPADTAQALRSNINHGRSQGNTTPHSGTDVPQQSSSRDYRPQPLPTGTRPGAGHTGASISQTDSPFSASFQRTGIEAFCRRTSLYLGFSYVGDTAIGQVYAEKLEPLRKHSSVPIILVHGNFHTGRVWLTKPDGDPGWASFFLNKGYDVYLVDVPPSGRSSWLDPNIGDDVPSTQPSLEFAENELTAPSKKSVGCWPTAASHSQWPGSGLRGDPIFDRYFASLSPLSHSRRSRQSMAQEGLAKVLRAIGPAVLIGEGAGANAAWLAADVEPSLVLGVIALEPAGPPFGNTFRKRESDGRRVYGQSVDYWPGVRPYGIADLPLAFDPPPNLDMAFFLDPEDNAGLPPLDVTETLRNVEGGGHSIVLQKLGDEDTHDPGSPPMPPRQLVNLKKIKHAVFTAHASFHSMYDEITCTFLKQAGVQVKHFALASAGIFGNGHLMFLEKNSDRLADMVHSCMKQEFPGLQPSRILPALPTPQIGGRRQSVALGDSASTSRLSAPSGSKAKAASRITPVKSKAGAQMTAINNERRVTNVGSSRDLPPVGRPTHSPIGQNSGAARGSGNPMSQMQRQIQSEHFQRIQQPRVMPLGQDLSRSAQPYAAALARNPSMPSPSRLRAFSQQIPGAMPLHMPERYQPSYMERHQQGEQQRACVPGTAPCNSPACQIHGAVNSQNSVRQNLDDPYYFPATQNQVLLGSGLGPASVGGGRSFSFNPTPTMLPPHLRQQAQFPLMPGSGAMAQGRFEPIQTARNVKTPTSQRGAHRPSGDTTISMGETTWQAQSPPTPTPGPRPTTAATCPAARAAPSKASTKKASAAAKKPNTKPKKTASEAEGDDDYTPVTKKSTQARARGGKAAAAAKKGGKGKKKADAEDDSAAVPTPASAPAPESKPARAKKPAATAKKAKKAKANTETPQDAEGDEIEAAAPAVALPASKPKAQKSTATKRKRNQADRDDGEGDATGGERKRSRGGRA